MGAIAYHDRFGRNNMPCYANPETLAKMAAIDPSNNSRHARRLAKFGYLKIGRNPADRRKRVYSLIYNENSAVDLNPDNNPETVGLPPEKVVSADDKTAAEVVRVDEKTVTVRRVKPLDDREYPERGAGLRDPTKQSLRDAAKRGAKVGKSQAPKELRKPISARQKARNPSTLPHQRDLQVFGDVSRARNLAEQRLGNAICKVPALYHQLDDKRWPGWRKAYERAVEVERQQPGKGINYLGAAARRARAA